MKMKMRRRYIISVIVIIALIIGLMYLLLYPPSIEESPFGRTVKNANIFVPSLAALLAAVIALSAADPKKPRIEAKVECFVSKDIEKWETAYDESDFTVKVSDFFKTCPKPIKSYKVQFKITNTSGFDWVNPYITFRLPLDRQHPQKTGNAQFSDFSYNSNTYNSSASVKVLKMVDGVIISNSNLPFWGQETYLTIWIKMVLGNCAWKTFDICIFIDCEGANGYQKTFSINPKMLLKDVGINFPESLEITSDTTQD